MRRKVHEPIFFVIFGASGFILSFFNPLASNPLSKISEMPLNCTSWEFAGGIGIRYGDNTPMPPSDAPEVAWQAYSAAKNNYTAEKAGKKVDEQAIAGILGTLAGILVVIILMQMGK